MHTQNSPHDSKVAQSPTESCKTRLLALYRTHFRRSPEGGSADGRAESRGGSSLARRIKRVTAVAALVGVTASATTLTGASPAGAADLSKLVSVNAPPATAAVTMPGDNVRVKFQGLAGQMVNVTSSAGTFADNCAATITLYRPDGVTALTGSVCGGLGGALPSVALPSNGMFQVFVDPMLDAVGSVKVGVSSSSAIKSITPGAATLTVPVASTSTTDFGFAVTAGKFVTLRVSGGNFVSACDVEVSLRSATGVPLDDAVCGGNGTVTIEAADVTASGIAKIRVVNTAGAAGSIKLQVWTGTHLNGTIAVDGAPVLSNLTTPGQRNRYTFSATSGQALTVTLTSATIPTYYVALIRPDETTMHYQSFGTGGGFIDAKVLDATGTWTVEVNPTGLTLGRTTVELDSVANDNGTITIGGAAKTATVNTSGQNVEWTFSGLAGQRVTTKLTNSTIAAGTVNVIRPNGTTLVYRSFGAADGFHDPVQLDATGTWRFAVDPTGTNTGSVTVVLNEVHDISGSITVGTPKSTTITVPGQRARYTFAGASGQRLSTEVSASTITSGTVVYLRPNGSQFTYRSFGTANVFFDPIQLDATGTWSVEIDPTSSAVGNATLALALVSDQTGGITFGGPAVGVNLTQAGQRARFTFTATSGQTLTTALSNVTIASGYVNLYSPTGAPLTYRSFGVVGVSFAATLNVTGTWTVEVDPAGTSVGTASLRLT